MLLGMSVTMINSQKYWWNILISLMATHTVNTRDVIWDEMWKDRVIDWMIDWLMGWFLEKLIDGLKDRFNVN